MIVEGCEHAGQDRAVSVHTGIAASDGVVQGLLVEDKILDCADRCGEDSIGRRVPSHNIQAPAVDGENESVAR